MNPGGEPERDETGLPPVDIEIPDDARDLDRDVQSYRRELRARRRSARQSRWRRSLGKDGVALPLLACCLVLALITGTLLTVFTATSNPNLGLPGSTTSAPARPGAPAMVTVGDQIVPPATIAVEGSSAALAVQRLGPAMLVLVPPDCGCASEFNWLAAVASTARVPAYVIYSSTTKAQVDELHSGLSSALRETVKLARETDNQNLLGSASYPAGIQAGRLTAILLAQDQIATWVSKMGPGDSQTPLIQALTGQPA